LLDSFGNASDVSAYRLFYRVFFDVDSLPHPPSAMDSDGFFYVLPCFSDVCDGLPADVSVIFYAHTY
jgi:hypothetical protein